MQPGTRCADGLDGELKELGAAVLAVVAIDAGDDCVAQAHGGAGFRYTARLVEIDRERRAFLHGAESAAPRADVAENHERSGAAIPAFAHVGTSRALAYRVQTQARDEFLQFAVIIANGRRGAEPFRPRRLRRNGDQHFISQCSGRGYMSRRFSSERDMVTSSANSRSLPTGMPIAMRVTRGPKRLQQAR